MSILDIKIYPDPVLSQRAAEVTKFDTPLQRLIDDMVETMYAAEGIGLAANQIGVLQRVAVVDISEDRSGVFHLINPVIVSRQGKISSKEGCLSIPDYRESIARSKEVVVQALDRHGKEFEIKADGLLSYCLQHEIDHLDGVLFVDHLSRLKREFFKKWAKSNLLA